MTARADTPARAAAPLLEVRDLRYTLRGKPLFAIDHLTLAAGNIALLTGDNGSGKSTLLRCLAGLLPPAHCASFRFAGQPRARPPAAVYLHQTPYLFNASVRANVEYGLRCCRLPLARAAAAMQWAGIEHLADAAATALSGGEHRRVALARVRALQPALYLLDEPLTHLDSNGKTRVRQLITQLRAEGATAIISSHQLDIPASVRWHLADKTIRVAPPPPVSAPPAGLSG